MERGSDGIQRVKASAQEAASHMSNTPGPSYKTVDLQQRELEKGLHVFSGSGRGVGPPRGSRSRSRSDVADGEAGKLRLCRSCCAARCLSLAVSALRSPRSRIASSSL